ncbi:ABC transporter ATP-binding protein [Aliihoeflea sp. 2WW]|uniref:ABC transporter ATP-binding protein n=1 Tax=Aliihoeflea sp. 2WW TaxID=1381123 RepID=UPI000465C9CC|nr:ABC transporter ATP-binding protein [Aliihoeflea sp. 2WW]
MSVLSVRDVAISFGGVDAIDGVGFEVEEREIFSIIGPNGAGKTTLFNIISGLYKPARGSVELAGASILGMPTHRLAHLGLCRTFQNLQIFFRMSVIENVMSGCHVSEHTGLTADLLGLPSMHTQNRATREVAFELLGRVELSERADEIAGNLAYGELKKLEIARALASAPRILLMDEPAAGCNATETQELGRLVAETAKSGVTIVLIEHDMKLVMGISDRVLVLNQGRRLAEGKPDEIRRDPSVIEAYLGVGAAEAGDA